MEPFTSAIEQHQPVARFALFSGGHDSLCSTHLAMTNGYADEVIHINTGIGVEQTRDFVRWVCQQYGWPLRELHPPKLQYTDIVRKFGFPGPGFHHIPYRWLKERALDQLVREAKVGHSRNSTVMLVTGARSGESSRRMGWADSIIKRGGKVWVAPIVDWDDRKKNEYMKANEIPRNEVVDLLHMSGECLCGAFAHKGELEEIRLWFPETVAYIDSLKPLAAESGRYSAWGIPHGKLPPPEQLPLCWSCEAKMEDWYATPEVTREAR